MSDKSNSDDLKKYTEDIATIKHILMEVEEKPLVEIWAFFSWGGVVMLGSLLHYLTKSYTTLPLNSILIRVWIPVFCIAAFSETIAFFKRMGKEELPLLSRNAVKLWLSLFAAFIGMSYIIFLLFDLEHIRYIPIFIEVLFAMMLLLYALISTTNLMMCSYFLIFGSIIHYHFQLRVHSNFIIAGILLGLTFIMAGIISLLQERKKRDEQ